MEQHSASQEIAQDGENVVFGVQDLRLAEQGEAHPRTARLRVAQLERQMAVSAVVAQCSVQ
jgi:hypothetical protein